MLRNGNDKGVGVDCKAMVAKGQAKGQGISVKVLFDLLSGIG